MLLTVYLVAAIILRYYTSFLSRPLLLPPSPSPQEEVGVWSTVCCWRLLSNTLRLKNSSKTHLLCSTGSWGELKLMMGHRLEFGGLDIIVVGIFGGGLYLVNWWFCFDNAKSVHVIHLITLFLRNFIMPDAFFPSKSPHCPSIHGPSSRIVTQYNGKFSQCKNFTNCSIYWV